MSLFKTWTFRSGRPEFKPGEELTVYLTDFDAGSGQGTARIGDSVFEVTGAQAEQVDQLVTLRVESFSGDTFTGRAVVT